MNAEEGEKSRFTLCEIVGLLMDFSHSEVSTNEEASRERANGGSQDEGRAGVIAMQVAGMHSGSDGAKAI